MKKVKVSNNKDGRNFEATFNTPAAANAWILAQESIESWGKLERWRFEKNLSQDQIDSAIDSRSVIINAETWESEEDLTPDQMEASFDMRAATDENGDPILNEDEEIVKEYKVQEEASELEYKLPKEFSVTIIDIGDTIPMAELRAERDLKIASTIWVEQRHRRELRLNIPPTITENKLTQWFIYWQALADLPENTIDPSSPVWPTQPTP